MSSLYCCDWSHDLCGVQGRPGIGDSEHRKVGAKADFDDFVLLQTLPFRDRGIGSLIYLRRSIEGNPSPAPSAIKNTSPVIVLFFTP